MHILEKLVPVNAQCRDHAEPSGLICCGLTEKFCEEKNSEGRCPDGTLGHENSDLEYPEEDMSFSIDQNPEEETLDFPEELEEEEPKKQATVTSNSEHFGQVLSDNKSSDVAKGAAVAGSAIEQAGTIAAQALQEQDEVAAAGVAGGAAAASSLAKGLQS